MFKNKVKELFDSLGESKIMCLATSESNRVTARSMSFIILDGKFYFQTDSRFLKYKQISENPRIAICYNNIQIEGICRELGHPLLPDNRFFAEKYKESYYISSYESYSNLESEVLFEISPVLISVWDYDDGKPYREYFDFEKKSYQKEYCDLAK